MYGTWKQPQVERTLSAPEGVAGIRARLEGGGITHRSQLADAPCADFGLRDARGRPPSVPDVLPAIHLEAPDLASLGTVELVAVDDDALRRVWTQLLHPEHPRGAGPFFGTHDGVRLQAGNRIRLGCTAGRGRRDRGQVSAETPEQVFVYSLERDWRRHPDLPRRSSAERHSATSDRSADW